MLVAPPALPAGEDLAEVAPGELRGEAFGAAAREGLFVFFEDAGMVLWGGFSLRFSNGEGGAGSPRIVGGDVAHAGAAKIYARLEKDTSTSSLYEEYIRKK